ncbi:MAG: hypothetical protein ACREDP_24540 [Bradyrhizobium sp.]
MNDKLIALRERLVDAQHKLLAQAAEGGMLPSDSALRRISDLEGAIAATEVMIQEQEAKPKAVPPR